MHFNVIEIKIKATQIAKADFVSYPDFEEKNGELNLADALTILIAEHFPDVPTSDIYDCLEERLKYH